VLSDRLIAEELLPFAEAARIVPRRRGGKATSPATLYRWAKVGLRGVRLEAVQAGGVLCTSRGAIARFFQELTEQRFREKPAVNADRVREIQEANCRAAELLR
jgi:hypothetical protein